MKRTAKQAPRGREAAEGQRGFAPVVAAFVNDRPVSRRRMFSSDNVLSVNGKIFAMLVRSQLVVKLPKARVDKLVSRRRGEPFDPGTGKSMKEWVAVGPDDPGWVALAQEANRFVKGGMSRPPTPAPRPTRASPHR